MTVQIMDGEAFVEISQGYLLHIASEEEVKRASYAEVQHMVEKAIEAKQLMSQGV